MHAILIHLLASPRIILLAALMLTVAFEKLSGCFAAKFARLALFMRFSALCYFLTSDK
jgi:hypothetical protein